MPRISKKNKKEFISKMLSSALDIVADEQLRLKESQMDSEYKDILEDIYKIEAENYNKALKYLEEL